MVRRTGSLLLILFSLLSITWLFGQEHPFEVSLEPVTIAGVGGLQSFAFGQADGKWLIVGGRLDGLHRRQPWASFDLAGHNNQLLVIDPVAQQHWTAPLTSLPVALQEQLRSTNMQFYQEGDYLYCLGGYGYSATAGDHTTYDQLAAIDVPAVIEAIVEGNEFADYFRQINDPLFQVTGGHLEKINDTYYLLGGQKFLGRYNPMGPDHGPGFVQEYTNAVRLFDLEDDGTSISITHLPSYVDPDQLHRRDYNAEPQILPGGSPGITLFSGVFRPDVDLPFLNSVTVDASGYSVDQTFEQLFNHYHCAVLPLYSAASNEMHTVFFGGIAQFYPQDGEVIQDDNVPFVKTIARVSRDANGTLSEQVLPVEMPAYLGAGAEFIPIPEVPQYANGVVMLDSLSDDYTTIGYIYGGISSSAANIFFINTGTESEASSQLYAVRVRKSSTTSVADETLSEEALKVHIFPNPTDGLLHIDLLLSRSEEVKVSVYDLEGRLVHAEPVQQLTGGDQRLTIRLDHLTGSGLYLVSVETSVGKRVSRVVLE